MVTQALGIRAMLPFIAVATMGVGPASEPARPAFVPITRVYLPLPAGMRPWYATFLAGGQTIIFHDKADGQLRTIAVNGGKPHCITCDFSDRPSAKHDFVQAFRDGKRVLLTVGVGAAIDDDSGREAWILECAPSLLDCASHRYVPVDLSNDRGPIPLFQRRTFHLSTDDALLGWMDVRADSTAIVAARLERKADRYVAADPRVINPVGPRGPQDDDPDAWERYSGLYELKGFTPDGRAVIAVGTPNNNVDIMRIELVDGRVTRLTSNPDWDEDSSLSPDGRSLVVNAWRGRHRLEPLAWIPQIRGFTGLMVGAAIAPYYVSTWEGFQCDISPWLLPATGDRGGQLLGQPVDVYDGALTAASHQLGARAWSSDSTRYILQERTHERAGLLAPSRIAIAHFGRPPTLPLVPASTAVGDWAPSAAAYRGPLAQDRDALVRGRAGGHATIQYRGHLGQASSTAVRFERFTDDGRTFVDGTISGASQNDGVGEKRKWRLLANIRVTGLHTGLLRMDLTLDNSTRPLPSKAGSVEAVYDGRRAPPLPALAPCYKQQPQPTPLKLQVVRRRDRWLATVTADVQGDNRPVSNAVVRIGSQSVKTDEHGVALLSRHPDARQIDAVAGNTFRPVTLALPKRPARRAVARVR